VDGLQPVANTDSPTRADAIRAALNATVARHEGLLNAEPAPKKVRFTVVLSPRGRPLKVFCSPEVEDDLTVRG
jgi:hypothetical protein